jgi:hypothetical protein
MTYGRGMKFYARYKLQKQHGAEKIEDIYQSWKDGKLDKNTTWLYYIGIIDFILANERDKESISIYEELEKAVEIIEEIKPGSYKNTFRDDEVPALGETNEIKTEQKSMLPPHPVLEEIEKSRESPIRKWNNGKFKCRSLPEFIMAYDRIKHDISPSLIRDYLVKKDGKPYSDKNIEKEMAENGIPRK